LALHDEDGLHDHHLYRIRLGELREQSIASGCDVGSNIQLAKGECCIHAWGEWRRRSNR